MPETYTYQQLVDAVFDVTDNGLSQHAAAQKHNVPQTTLSGRLKGIPSKEETSVTSQLPSVDQEANPVQWILKQVSVGYAPSHSQVRACVTALPQA